MRLIDSAGCELTRDFAKHVLHQHGFPDPGRPHEQYDPRAAAKGSKDFDSCSQVILARIQEIRIRAQTKGKLVETKKLRVHVISCQKLSHLNCGTRIQSPLPWAIPRA